MKIIVQRLCDPLSNGVEGHEIKFSESELSSVVTSHEHGLRTGAIKLFDDDGQSVPFEVLTLMFELSAQPKVSKSPLNIALTNHPVVIESEWRRNAKDPR